MTIASRLATGPDRPRRSLPRTLPASVFRDGLFLEQGAADRRGRAGIPCAPLGLGCDGRRKPRIVAVRTQPMDRYEQPSRRGTLGASDWPGPKRALHELGATGH